MDENIHEGQYQEIPEQKTDKLADMIGLYLGAIIFTMPAAVCLSFFLTFIPKISFSLPLVLKCWSGIWSAMFMRGALTNKMI